MQTINAKNLTLLNGFVKNYFIAEWTIGFGDNE